jgi:hypothetical protein
MIMSTKNDINSHTVCTACHMLNAMEAINLVSGLASLEMEEQLL